MKKILAAGKKTANKQDITLFQSNELSHDLLSVLYEKYIFINSSKLDGINSKTRKKMIVWLTKLSEKKNY